MAVSPKFLREALKQHETWRDEIANGGSDTISDGTSIICFWDLFRGFETLTHKQALALFLTTIAGMTTEEAARAMGYTGVRSRDAINDYVKAACKKLTRFHEDSE